MNTLIKHACLSLEKQLHFFKWFNGIGHNDSEIIVFITRRSQIKPSQTIPITWENFGVVIKEIGTVSVTVDRN